MITVEYVLIDRKTNKVGRYQFSYDDDDELKKMLDVDMLLTLPEMVDCVLNEFSQQDRTDYTALKKDELIHLHHTTGQDIRNAFGLWLEDNPNVPGHPDDTSMEIMELIWERLQNTGSGGGSKPMDFI